MLLRCLGVLALTATGCTLDYDALITGSGGGDGATSSADATTTTTATASTGSSTTTGTTTTASTSTSSGGGGGGGGQGGEGAAGGAGGQGGAGGELPFAEPCPGLPIIWTDELGTSLGEAWEEANGNDVEPTTTAADGLTISLEGEPGSEEGAALQTTSEEALSGCSVTVAVTGLDPDVPEEGVVEAGLAAGDLGIQIVVAPADEGGACTVRTGDLGGEADEVPCSGEAPERFLRVRHTGDEVCFDVAPLDGEPFAQVGRCYPVEGARRVFFGAAAETTGRVTFGKVL